MSVKELTVEETRPKPSTDRGFKIFKLWRKKKRTDRRSLTELYEIALSTLVVNRNETTGLLPIDPNTTVASVYDNVSAALALWALSIALNKAGKRTHVEIIKIVKKIMTTILEAFKYQVNNKDDTYYKHFPGVDPLVRLDINTGLPTTDSSQIEINQSEDGASKMESVAFFLLALVKLTAGGLDIIVTVEDVNVIQNLVVYLQSIYLRIDTDVDSARNRIKFEDPTMKVSTVAMIKSAIEALTALLMSGKQFGIYSVQVFQFEAVQLRHLLKHLVNKVLSLEWLHPNVISIISYPILAIQNVEKREAILSAFIQKYHFEVREEPEMYFSRDLLQVYCYICLSLLFYGRLEQAEEYRTFVNQYFCPFQEEFNMVLKHGPGSDNSFSYFTSTSLFLTISLISYGYLNPKDIDPLKVSALNPSKEIFSSGKLVHVVALVDNKLIHSLLKKNGIECQLISDLSSNYHIFSDDILHHFFSILASSSKETINKDVDKSKKLFFKHASGTSPSNIFYTSQIYTLMKHTIIFVPRVLEKQSCYLSYDLQMFIDLTINNIKYLSKNWNLTKIPLYFIPITSYIRGINSPLQPEIEKLFRKLKSGLLDGVKVKLVKMPKTTDQYYTFNFNLILSDKSEAKEILKSISSLSEFDYSGGIWKSKKKQQPTKGSKESSSTVKGTSNAQIWKEPSEDLKMALNFSGILGSKDLQESHSMERLENILSNWKTLNLNWLPEQIIGFITSDGEVVNGQSVTEEECIKLLMLFKTSTNLMEKAYTIKKLYTLRGINWFPPDWLNSPEWLNTLTQSKEYVVDKKHSDLRSSMNEMFRISAWGQVWWMVRFTAGLIGMRLENISLALSDIVVRRRKQIIIGCTANNKIVIAKPHHDLDIMTTIQIVARNNPYMISLLQELLLYVWMIYQTNRTVFDQMVCVDIQAIYQAMVTDMSIRFECNEDMATTYVACLSPYELKCYVEVILRGDEMSKTKDVFELGRNLARHKHSGLVENIDSYLQPGVWLKRRCLDGVLMRLPNEFILGVWQLLTKCKGLSFDGRVIKSDVTEKYSDQNLNFTAILYSTLRLVRPPELLNLVVETIFLLSRMFSSTRLNMEFKKVINITEILFAAVNLFLRNQSLDRERISRNCCTPSKNLKKPPTTLEPSCKSRGGICWQFYDSAPTGEFGTMAFITDAVIALHTECNATFLSMGSKQGKD